MTKPKTWEDPARSFDADWPPHHPITLRTWWLEPAPSIGILLLGVTQAAMTPTIRMRVSCSNACWLTQGVRAARA
jgi:hypothetical protein